MLSFRCPVCKSNSKLALSKITQTAVIVIFLAYSMGFYYTYDLLYDYLLKITYINRKVYILFGICFLYTGLYLLNIIVYKIVKVCKKL